jgi:hypothetical protein
MKYAVEMASCGMIYVPSFINIGSSIQRLLGGGYTYGHRQQGDLINLLFFLNEENRPKTIKTNGRHRSPL